MFELEDLKIKGSNCLGGRWMWLDSACQHKMPRCWEGDPLNIPLNSRTGWREGSFAKAKVKKCRHSDVECMFVPEVAFSRPTSSHPNSKPTLLSMPPDSLSLGMIIWLLNSKGVLFSITMQMAICKIGFVLGQVLGWIIFILNLLSVCVLTINYYRFLN